MGEALLENIGNSTDTYHPPETIREDAWRAFLAGYWMRFNPVGHHVKGRRGNSDRGKRYPRLGHERSNCWLTALDINVRLILARASGRVAAGFKGHLIREIISKQGVICRIYRAIPSANFGP